MPDYFCSVPYEFSLSKSKSDVNRPTQQELVCCYLPVELKVHVSRQCVGRARHDPVVTLVETVQPGYESLTLHCDA